MTNVVALESADGRVRARSKGLGGMTDGSCGSATYDDTLVNTPTAGGSVAASCPCGAFR
ncbi:hypothetical protein AB5J72_46400 [Streptomyces sp. CG1]|uniref:hypothetical protein n=1 Tax=Streptomyces sp. CG1 TaxID=1287523 RepID=UPI0034E27BDD